MKYDFDLCVNRRGTASVKWAAGENELPMWVADMEFKADPAIISAIQNRVQHGIFGYAMVPPEWYSAVCNWWSTRHNFSLQEEWLLFCAGTIPAISNIIRNMTKRGENVLLQTPVYNMFFDIILSNGRNVVENELKYENCVYEIDFTDLERKLADPQTTMMILCNPHNPIGKIWNKETLARIGALCSKYKVLVVSDEIHCDLTDPGYAYVPFASVSECCAQNSITCVAPTKSFNIAGMKTAAVIVPNENIRQKVKDGFNVDEVSEPNTFAIDAAIAAFSQGAEWLDSLRDYLLNNKRVVQEFIEKELPQVKLVASCATYLLWLDCKALGISSNDLSKFIRQQSGLWLVSGRSYGQNGDGFLRMNIACPKAQLMDGLRRLKNSIEAYEHSKYNIEK